MAEIKERNRLELASVREKHKTERAEMAELARKNQKEKTQFDELRNDFDRKMAEIKERNSLELAAAQEEHEAEMQRRTQSYDRAKAAADARRQDLDPKAAAHAQGARLAQAKADYQEELEELASQHKRALEQQTARQNRALEQSRRDFESQKAQIAEDISELSSKKSELQSIQNELESAQSELEAAKSRLSSVRSQVAVKHAEAEPRRKSRQLAAPFLCFASFIPIAVAPGRKGTALRLALSIPASHSSGAQARVLSRSRFCVADLSPQVMHQQSSVLFPFQESRLQGAFSRISEIQAQPQDPGRFARARELNYKLTKVHGKIDVAVAGLGAAVKDSMDQIGNSCQSVKSLTNEQAKTITQLTFDFQQQTGQLSRSFQSAISDVEGSFRAAMSFVSSLRQFPLLTPHAPVFPAPDYEPHAARPKRVQRRVEPEVEDGQQHAETPVDGTLRMWRREARKSRADRTRISQQFKQLKQKIPED
jgi:hypothetical protein